jgi:putative solute:sodium symporter small subunit
MSEDDVKQAYWRSIRLLTVGMLALFAASMLVLPLFMPALNAYRFLRFPLGYFLVADASVLVLAVLIYGFFSGQQRSDRAYNMTIQF